MGEGDGIDRLALSKLKVVADASALIALSQLGLLETVAPLFIECVVPPAVAREIAPSVDRPEWIRVVAPINPIATRITDAKLGAGETEVIALGLERGSPQVVLDDRDARRLAIAMGLPVLGTAGLLVIAKRSGLIPVVGVYLEALVALKFFLAPQVIRRTLIDADEAE